MRGDEFQCLDCESWHSQELWDQVHRNAEGQVLVGAGCCPSCGEGQCLEFAARRDAAGRALPSEHEEDELRRQFPGLAGRF